MINNVNNTEVLLVLSREFNNLEMDVKIRTAFLNDETYFNLSDSSYGLGHTKVSKGSTYLRKERVEGICKSLDITGLSAVDNRFISITKEDDFENIYISEDSFYDFALESRTECAKTFRKWITKDVIPSINGTGKYDLIEDQLNRIEDAKERELKIKLYKMQGILKSSPDDMLLTINYNSTKTELEIYLNSKAIEEQNKKLTAIEEANAKIIEDTELIKEQQKYVCDRTNFSEKMKILANKYFGRNIQDAYVALYSKMKTLGSFDVVTRRNNKLKEINEDRVAQGKKPYSESTLRQKYNMLDVIEDNGKWELCSEAYKTIEMERFSHKDN